MGASGVSRSGRAGDLVCGDTSEEINNSSKAYTTCRAARQRLRDAGLAGEGRSSSLEQLVRPPLPGRKAHRKTHRGRWREGIQEREEAEHGADKEKRRGRQRWTRRIETHAEGSPFRQGREGVETFSGSNSDIQSSEVGALEAGEGSNFQMGQRKPYTSTLGLNAQPPVSARCSAPLHPSPQNRSASLSSRTSAEELHHYPCTSSRESDPFWAVVRTGARAGTSQNQHTQTPLPSVSGSEQEEEGGEEEEEGEDDDVAGGGVMEVTGQSTTSVAVRPCAPLGERRMSKREKNRMKCLRRRQRRRETWRGQLQETQQVSHANVITLMCFFLFLLRLMSGFLVILYVINSSMRVRVHLRVLFSSTV